MTCIISLDGKTVSILHSFTLGPEEKADEGEVASKVVSPG